MARPRLYDGVERRQFLKVRKAIDDDTFGEKDLWKKMARMLGPDKLRELEAGLTGKKYSDSAMDAFRIGMNRGGVGRYTGIVVENLRLRAQDLPDPTLNRDLGDKGEHPMMLPEEAVKSLRSAGLATVGDFVKKSKTELVQLGVPENAIAEAANVLLYYGIRTVDNPPTVKT